MTTRVTDAQAQSSTVHAPAPLTAVDDVESSLPTRRIRASLLFDIENVQVDDDPRQWSPKLKVSPFFFRFVVFSRSAVAFSSSIPIGR
jgi:hypothetical protein